MSFRNLLALAAVIALTACGGNQSSSTTKTQNQAAQNAGVMSAQSANPSPSTAVNPPMGGIDASGEPMAPGTLATQPPNMQCGAVQAVWVNTKTHVYHEPSDPFYGRTKHGKYMCPSQAVKEGYHKAGAHAKHSKSSDSDNDSSGQ